MLKVEIDVCYQHYPRMLFRYASRCDQRPRNLISNLDGTHSDPRVPRFYFDMVFRLLLRLRSHRNLGGQNNLNCATQYSLHLYFKKD